MSEPINGIWSQFTADKYHQSSPKLALWLSSYLDPEQHVIDFGCGNGFYLKCLSDVGFNCTGVEGMKLNNFLFKNICIHDLTKPIHLAAKGSVLCLEVLEHIPAQYESVLIDSIVNHCTKDLILSWAEKNQPGVGHINTVDQEYAIKRIVERGFRFLPETTKDARANIDDQTDWFRRTLLVFRKKIV